MKKLIIYVLLTIMLFLTGCGGTTTSLTKNNYKDVLTIEYKIENCTSTTQSGYFSDTTKYHCNVVVITKAKNNATFENCEIKFNLYCGYGMNTNG